MAKVKLNLGRINIAELLRVANLLKTKFTGHTLFTAPEPTVPDFGILITTLTTKSGLYDEAKRTADQALSERDAAQLALENGIRSWAAYAESKTKDAAMLQSGGFDLRSPGAPINEVAQVSNLSLTGGDNEGEIDAQWDPVRGAKSYEIQFSLDPNAPASWSHKAIAAKSKASLGGFTLGTRIWIRVRAIGSAAQGPWSDPATKLVA